jgi:hypothetical protein
LKRPSPWPGPHDADPAASVSRLRGEVPRLTTPASIPRLGRWMRVS